jgi:lysophospholipase L1-like esterase
MFLVHRYRFDRYVYIPLLIGTVFFLISIFLNRKKSSLAITSSVAKKILGFIESILFVTYAILGTFLIIELLIRLLMGLNVIKSPSLADLPPYQNAEYVTDQFLQESDFRKHKLVYDENGVLVQRNFTGQYINIIDHIRKTIDQPENPDHKIHVFGGSTTICLEVPDEYTFASLLQQSLSEDSELATFKVVNYGVLGATTDSQLQRLKTISIEAGDIVIFYSGYNDLYRFLELEYPINMVGLKISGYSILFRSFFYPFIDAAVPVGNPNYQVLADRYIENIIDANRIAEENGAFFINLIQPSLFSVTNVSEYEQAILDNAARYPGKTAIFFQGHKVLSAVTPILIENGIISYDISNIFNDREQGPQYEIFLDAIHVNHVGNQIVAEEIFKILLKTFQR